MSSTASDDVIAFIVWAVITVISAMAASIAVHVVCRSTCALGADSHAADDLFPETPPGTPEGGE